MLFFYIRHGDPIYDPDSLTALGKRQAEAVARRLALYGIDEIYASTSTRAIQTATPTSEILKKPITKLDFANESHAWRELTVVREDTGNKSWMFQDMPTRALFNTDEVRELGFQWYAHPAFKDYDFKAGIDRIQMESDAFFASFGYVREGVGKYKVVNGNNKRVAMFAHQGFGLAFLSCIIGSPYPMFSSHFDMSHTGLTVIEFPDEGGYSHPKILTMASDSHLYRDGLPTKYNNSIYF